MIRGGREGAMALEVRGEGREGGRRLEVNKRSAWGCFLSVDFIPQREENCPKLIR